VVDVEHNRTVSVDQEPVIPAVDAGHRLHIVPARGVTGAETRSADATTWWLTTHRIPHHSLHVVPSAKADTAIELGLHAAIDDAPHHYDELEAAGANPYLMSRPWNAGHPGRRADSWDHFVVAVLAQGARDLGPFR
jgi:hypothetical protein